MLIFCSVLFVEDRIEAFVPEVKNFAEMKVEAALNGKVKFSIGSLEGGILNPITLTDIEIKGKRDSPLLPDILISSIKTNLRLWDVFRSGGARGAFGIKGNASISRLLSGITRVDVNFATVNKDISGFVRIENDSRSSKLKGYINLPYANKIDFAGVVKQDFFDIEIRPRRGVLIAHGAVREDGSLNIDFKADHLRLFGFETACEGTLKNKVTGAADGLKKASMEGELQTRGLALNHKPFLDLKTDYRISNGILQISDFRLGDIFQGRGSFLLRKPHNTNFTLTANNMSISWLLIALGSKDAAPPVTGTMNGKFEFKGPLENLKSDMQFEIRKGTLSVLDFEYLSARLKGDGALLRIEDCRITRESGFFVLGGEMDLRRMGKNSLFSDIKIVSDDGAINWDGWDASKWKNIEEVTMTKKINDEINLDFKKFISGDNVDESLKSTDEVQLEYKLHPNDSLKMTVGQDKDFFGFEHKDKF